MIKPNSHKALRTFLIAQARAAQADLDQRMSTVPKVCKAGCDACCHQMVSVHLWEEELIGQYIETSMHAKTKAQVRKQLLDWWRYLKTVLRPATQDDPIRIDEVQQLQVHMARERVMCPFLVDHQCSIYPVRPAICRSHTVPDEPKRCETDPLRVGNPQSLAHLAATFGPESPHLPLDKYPHAFKPLAFAMTGAFKLAVPSTPMHGLGIGDSLPGF